MKTQITITLDHGEKLDKNNFQFELIQILKKDKAINKWRIEERELTKLKSASSGSND